MHNAQPLVSIIIPTINSAQYLGECLNSIKQQSYKSIETIIVDGGSVDNTISLARKYKCKILHYKPKVAKGVFDAPHKRNYGVEKANGVFVYYVDADMVLSKSIIEEAVELCTTKFDAVILPEDSFGEGIWAKAKQLERRCYWGDDSVEAPRFFRKEVWKKVGGLDVAIGGGGDDWDLYQKILDKGYTVGRTKNVVLHNEGKLQLGKLAKKRFMYGRETVKYLVKRPAIGAKSYFPIRKAYILHWKLFLRKPSIALAFLFMRTIEYLAGFTGILYSLIKK